MKKILILIGFLLPFNVLAGECINTWTFQEGKKDIFKIQQCVNSSGGSGTYKLENLTSDKAKACWKITFNNGKSKTGCRTLDGHEKGSGSCYSCAPKNSGVSDVTLTKFRRK